MTIGELLLEIRARDIRLRKSAGELILAGDHEALDESLVSELRAHKAALFDLIASDSDAWWSPPIRITPEMLPLVQLTAEEIERIVDTVPGGAENVQDIYPLAPLQEGILFHHLMGGEGDPYLLAIQLSFDSRDRLDAYLGAMKAVIDRQDVLRTAVAWEGLSQPVQVVWRKAALPVEEVELDAALGDAGEQLYARFHPRHYRMNVRQAPLLRVSVAHDAAQGRWLMMQLLHHLAGDHSTLDVMQDEIQAHLLGQADKLPTPLPFRNLVAQARLGASAEEHEAFFREMLADVDEPTAPFGLLDVQGDGTGVAEAWIALDKDLARRLWECARKLRVSAASLCHLAWAQVLGRSSGRDDVVFGTVLLGRMQGDTSHRAMGLFINTVPIRIQLGEQGVEAGVRRVHSQLTALLRHEQASLAMAQRCSAVPAPTPLFSALLNYRHSAGSQERMQALEGVRGLLGEDRTNYPLVLSVDDVGERFLLTAQVRGSIEPARVCGYMRATLESLVEALERAPATPVCALNVLSEQERNEVVYASNDTRTVYAKDRCIHELFEAQAAQTPDAIAVAYEGEILTYRELNRQANRLAHYLTGLGVKPDDRVALCAERSLEMVIGIVAVLKAGAAYVPLDPASPPERLDYMLRDSAPVVLLLRLSAAVRGPLSAVLSTGSIPVLDLQANARAWLDASEADLRTDQVGLEPQHLAYVIYTSGSTGKPKGVMVEHGNLVRLFSATQDWFHFDRNDIWTLFHSYAFDFSVWEIWGALAYGGKLVIVPQVTTRSPEDFYRLLCTEVVTILNQTPSAFRQLLAAQTSGGARHHLRQVIFGGEALEVSTLRPWYERESNRETRLVNMYGITETTVHVTYRPLEKLDTATRGSSPIGCRIPDLKIYILDAHRQPVPKGAAGELYVGGAGVARGYLNRPELTAERFLPDPFSADPYGRMYKTGDVGRFWRDSEIEYLGRNDHQVKIRGFRIELGEIEARLAEHPNVREAVVVAREDHPGEKRLVAYLIAQRPAQEGAAAAELDVEALRAYVSLPLPEYMVPAAYVWLSKFPLTVNGKLDHKALPAPDGAAFLKRGYEAPVGEVETTMARIWAEVLKLERVGRNDNFFELGGHSLLALTLIERMREAALSVDVRALFTAPTLKGLAEAVGGESRRVVAPPNLIPAGAAAITPAMLPLVSLSQNDIDKIVAGVPGGAANVQDIYPLAPLQEGILFHHLLGREGDVYLTTELLSAETREQLDRYVGALQAVINRHDILRTAVVWEELPEPVQVVWRHAPLNIEEVKLDAAAGDIAAQLRARFDPRHFRLDLRKAPLWRVFIAEDVPNNRWVALELVHHLVDDNTSARFLLDEIQAILQGQAERLPVPLPFRNFVAQARLGVSREEHKAFFTRMLGDVDEPTSPFGLTNVQGDGSQIVEAGREVDPELCQRLRAQARALGITAASLCHLAWALVLARVSGRDDVVFGTVMSGRMQGGEGADRVLGIFINTLPVRIQVGDEAVRASARKTHELLIQLLKHEHAPLVLVQRCSLVRAPAPLFTSLLNYRHIRAEALSAEKGTGETRTASGMKFLAGQERTNFPFSLFINDLGQRLSLDVQVDGSIDPQQVSALMHTALESLVGALEKAPESAIGSLQVVPEKERQQVLYEWNATHVEYPRNKCIHELFEDQVKRTPQALAAVFENESVSYDELNRRANLLAHYLRGMGVKADDRVGICAERGIAMIVALLAVLKAGGAYVPLDPEYPEERLRFMVNDSGPVAVLTQRYTTELMRRVGIGIKLIELDGDAERWKTGPETNPERSSVGLTAEHLAYVIYTSGSTGVPKGVMLEHRNTVNLICWAHQVFSADVLARTLFSTSLNFDLAVYECFVPLTTGAGIRVVANALGLAGGGLDVTLINTVPSVMKTLLEQNVVPPSVQVVNMAGEPLKRALVEGIFAGTEAKQVCNLYGPTETTTYSTWVRMQRDDGFAAHAGRPVANTRVYILDRKMEPAPVRVAGEIHIGGAGVARGYLHREELTAERFVQDPFSEDAGARMYRTGDFGRWLGDGNIEFLGRNDFQVKIRGFRIELGEIEARLAEHPSVSEAVVIALDDTPGGKRLVAYYTTGPREDAVPGEELRSHLSTTLPEHMVPAAYVCLKSLPLTPNGKLDRKALPAPEEDAYTLRGYEPPQGETEKKLATIWAETLKLQRIGRNDDFFGLGGHSLLAVTLSERMRREGFKVDVRTLFANPTLAEVAATTDAAAPAVEVPPNLIPFGCEAITPEMLPLVTLTQEEIDHIVSTAPDGAANVQDIYPLAPLQEGILFHHLLGREGDPYLLAGLVSFDTRTRLERYLQAMQSVVGRHDILRTAIVWEGLPEAVQVVWRRARLQVEEIELDPGEGDASERLYDRFNPRRFSIDVRRAPMLRLYIAFDREKNGWLLLLLLHHLVGDHTTLEVIEEEVQAHLLGRAEQLPAPLPFRNLVAQARLGISKEQHEAFFRQMLGDVEETTAPFGLLDVQGDGTGIEEAGLLLENSLARRIREQARKLKVSAASLCHLAWAVVLAKVSGRQDVVFGTVLLGRMQGSEGADRVMGLFINTLPMRIRLGAQRVKASICHTHTLLTDLLRHEHASLALAQRCSRVPAPAPLFSALLNYRHSAPADQAPSIEALQAWQGIRGLRGEQRTNYPFSLSVDDLGEGFSLDAQTLASIGPLRVCEYMHTALEEVVAALETGSAKPTCTLDVLPEAERHQLIYEWNETSAEFPQDKCVHELFEEQVAGRPHALAAMYEDTELSYGELNRRANQLGHYLRTLGVGPDTRVAICVERSLEMIVGLLGILKAGGAYVALDPAYPIERWRYMLEDSAPVALLTQAHLKERFGQLPVALPMLDLNDGLAWSSQPESNPAASVGLSPEHLAYVIYTSGSTGQPKGVMIAHRALCNQITALQERWGTCAQDRLLQFASITFDASVEEIFGALLSGAALVMRSDDWLGGSQEFWNLVEKQGITVVDLPTRFWSHILEDRTVRIPLNVRLVIIGGEAAERKALANWFTASGHRPPLWNSYGPTETTVNATLHPIPSADCSKWESIGRPIANTRVYVLDEYGEPVPVGVRGELHIAGAGVGRGYLNRQELTAERFIADRFSREAGARMYQTGDVARFLPDGDIEFLGRNDFQVKIRGYRIELGEIETRLREQVGVRAAVVTAQEDGDGEKRLVGYYTEREGWEGRVGANELRAWVAEKLPQYMVPAGYVRLQEMPLTENGKLDRSGLRAPGAEAYGIRGYEEPVGETEQAVAAIWAEVLKIERIGRHDNFFELGGHSLLAMQTIARLRQRLGVEVGVDTLFARPVLAPLAERILDQQLATFDADDLANALKLMEHA